MATPNQNSPEILREEILADARRQSEEIIHHAKQEAEALLAKATAQADKARQECVDQARLKTDRRRESALATVPVEADRLRLARVEALLESMHEEIRRRLTAREGFDYRETIITLSAEAVKQMPASAFVVKLSAADRAALGEGLAGDIVRRVGPTPLEITISSDANLTEGGAIIEDTGGLQVWDNRLLARLERLWPELRRQIAAQTSLVGDNKTPGGVA